MGMYAEIHFTEARNGQRRSLPCDQDLGQLTSETWSKLNDTREPNILLFKRKKIQIDQR